MTTPHDAEGELDGAYEAFRERVSWLYKNAPECQEARKHSFGRQADVAFTLAMAEREAAVYARAMRDAQAVVAAETLVDQTGYPTDLAYNQAIADALAALTRLAALPATPSREGVNDEAK